MARILVVGPDPDLVALLRFACARVPHDVLVATAAPSALTLVRQAAPDLTLIDVARPGGQGLILLRQVRAASTRPIIVLTARRSDAHQIACFDAGADDCVSMPVSMPVLLHRVQAQLRGARLPAPARAWIEGRETRINVETNELRGAAGCVTLTPTEGRLLRQLLAARGHPLSVRGLAQRLWGPYGGGEGAVKSHMCHLRSKLRAAGGASPRIDTVAGLGYLLQEWA